MWKQKWHVTSHTATTLRSLITHRHFIINLVRHIARLRRQVTIHKTEFTKYSWGCRFITKRLLCGAFCTANPNKLETGPFVYESISTHAQLFVGRHEIVINPVCQKETAPTETQLGGADRAADDWWLNTVIYHQTTDHTHYSDVVTSCDELIPEHHCDAALYCCLSKVKLTTTQEVGQI